MRSFGIAAAIAAVLVIGGIMFNVCVNSVSGQLLEGCEEIEVYLSKGDFEGAGKAAKELGEKMDGRRILLASFINHEGIDEIELCLSELQGYCEGGLQTEAEVRCKKLEHLFYHLPANYGVSLENIL